MLRQITFLFNKVFPRARQNFKYFLTSVIDSIQRCMEIDFFFANDWSRILSLKQTGNQKKHTEIQEECVGQYDTTILITNIKLLFRHPTVLIFSALGHQMKVMKYNEPDWC